MKSDVAGVRRARVARPRRDTIALTIPKNALWLAGAIAAAFGVLSFCAGMWVGGRTEDRPTSVSTRVMLPAQPLKEETAAVEPSEVVPVAPPAKAPAIELDFRERTPRGQHGIQLGAFADREEAMTYLHKNAAELSAFPIYILPAKVGAKGVWYRVRAGSFGGKDEAEAAREALSAEVAKGSMVVRYH